MLIPEKLMLIPEILTLIPEKCVRIPEIPVLIPEKFIFMHIRKTLVQTSYQANLP